jgi:hypothetical protein
LAHRLAPALEMDYFHANSPFMPMIEIALDIDHSTLKQPFRGLLCALLFIGELTDCQGTRIIMISFVRDWSF